MPGTQALDSLRLSRLVLDVFGGATLERTFFVDQGQKLLGGHAAQPRGTEELGLAAVGFLSAGGVPEGLGGGAVGLASLGAPLLGCCPRDSGALLQAELVVVLFGRPKSAAQGGTRDNTCSAEKGKREP